MLYVEGWLSRILDLHYRIVGRKGMLRGIGGSGRVYFVLV